jgi:acyl-CoA thioesterase FadM
MTAWTQTYRGAVPPWQCDVTEHFTIAYYFDRLEEAQANLGIPLPDTGRITARFVRELRQGAAFHIESAAIQSDAGLRLGHRVIDSANNGTVTWFDQHWDAPATAAQEPWPGPPAESRPEPKSFENFLPTGMGRTKPADLDAKGNFSLGAMILRFSYAGAHLAAATGMQQPRRGFSTFELSLRLTGTIPGDAPYAIRSGIAYLGSSSMRILHRLTHGDKEIATLGQFGVNLDLDARRPAQWPDDVRGKATKLKIPMKP